MKITAEAALGLAWVIDSEGADVFLEARPGSPWLSVDFPTKEDQYAIWQLTGAVHTVGKEGYTGAVSDEPIYVPAEYSKQQAADRLMRLLTKAEDERDRAVGENRDLKSELAAAREQIVLLT